MFKQKLSPIGFTVFVSILLLPCILGFFYALTTLEQREHQRWVQSRAQTQFQKVQSAFSELTSLLQSLRSLVELSPNLTQREFDYFISSQPIADYGIGAFEWIPKVAANNLDNWIAEIKSTGQFNFSSNYNALLQNENIKDVFPIKYSSSSQMEGFSLGNNLAQDNYFAPLLIKAHKATNVQLAITSQSRIEQMPISRFLLGAYSGDDLLYADLLGFVGVSFNFEEAINILVGKGLKDLNLCLKVNKIEKSAKSVKIYHSQLEAVNVRLCDQQMSNYWSRNYSFAGEKLVFSFYDIEKSGVNYFVSASQFATLAFVIALFCCLFYLYTSRKHSLKVEDLIRIKQEHLEDVTADYSNLFMQSIDGLYTANLQGELLKVNPAFSKAFNYENDADICGQIKDIKYQLHADHSRYQQFMDVLLAKGQVTNFEWLGVTSDKQSVWLLENAYLVSDDEGVASHYQGYISIISARKNAELKLQYQAQYDALTGLRNRASFVTYIDHKIEFENEGNFAVFFIDIDRFKSINDSFGHTTGDELLVKFAKRISDRFDHCQVARFGGDEFAIFLDGVADKNHLQELSQRLRAAIQPCFNLARQDKLTVTASIGGSLLTRHCTGSTQALQQADLAMYEVKQQGRNNIAIYDHQLSLQFERRLKLESLLNEAITSNQFYLVYQPIMDLKRLKIAGFETLVRWCNPEVGEVSPTEFIPILEDLNMISQLGSWILEQACEKAAKFVGISDNSELFLNINVSPKQFIFSDIASLLEQQLSKFRLAAKNIHIEVTETEIYAGEETLMRQLQRIHALGIGIYIDDFGTGHSSLERLVNYPLKGIKLDRSFVSGLKLQSNNAIVLEATVRMADLLGLQVTAEGIEEKYQQDFFSVLGCKYAQGYLYDKPLTLDQAILRISKVGIRKLKKSGPCDSK
ncbi:MAG: EAL domain-containing protein [Oceanospirillaceae bacterium]